MFEEIFEKVSKSVCFIKVLNDDETIVSFGSGVLVENGKEDRYVMTAAHVVNMYEQDKGDCICITFPTVNRIFNYDPNNINISKNINFGKKITVKDVVNYELDIARIKFPKNEIPALKFDSKSEIRLGKNVFIAGFPDETNYPIRKEHFVNSDCKKESKKVYEDNPMISMKPGYVSSLIPATIQEDEDDEPKKIMDYFYVDKPMYRGASGGGVFDIHGNCIGIMIEIQEVSTKQLREISVRTTKGKSGISNNKVYETDFVMEFPLLSGTTICIRVDVFDDNLFKQA
ncbi:S1 family peptidase [Neisseria mucosa]|uniref:S1 family peptidase n=1 Tax=Neisseria mucosa TaxID=488 RepID=UPI0027E0CA40|nr:serine protease [Neisseria mucosa]